MTPGQAQANDFTPTLDSAALVSAITGGTPTPSTGISARLVLTIDANGRAIANVALPIFDDTTPETDETFTVTLSEPSGGSSVTTATATTTIAANDRTWAISPVTSTVNEAESAIYTVLYTGSATEQGSTVSILVTVGFTTGQAQANDFTPTLTSTTLRDAISGGTPTPSNEISAMVALTVGADGTVSADVVLPILDDATSEGDETFTVTLSGQSGGTITTPTATTTIAASDMAPSGAWAITPETSTVDEGGTASYNVQYTGSVGETVSILVTVNLDIAVANDFNPDLTSATLRGAISGGTTTAGPNGIISARVELTAGVSGNASFSFDLMIQDDTTVENTETFTVTLSGQTPETTITTPTATTTIAANDMTPDGMWAISQTSTPTVNEGDDASYNVQYTGSADEQGATISILVTVNLTTAVADDFIPTLTSATLRDAISAGTATAGDTGISARVELTIEVSGNANFIVALTILDDQTEEGNETFTVTLAEPSGRSSVNSATATTTIAASDLSGTWTISSTTPTVNEGDDTSYNVQYNGNPVTQGATISILVTVEFTGANPASAEDFDPIPLTSANLADLIGDGATAGNEISAMVELTIDANGNASASIALPIVDDETEEGEETFTVTLSQPSGDSSVMTPTATTTIAANDISGTWAISQAPTEPVNEGDDASYTVQYTGNPATQGLTGSILVTVVLDTAQDNDFDLDPATSGIQPLTSAHLATFIGAGATAGDTGISAMVTLTIDENGIADFSFDLTIGNDETEEGPETFMITLSRQTTGTTITIPTATTTIAASDITLSGMWAITPENQTVNEGETASYNVQYTGTS